MFKYFFFASSQIPDGLGWDLYGTEHLLWLLSLGLIIALTSILYKNSNTEKRKKIIKSIALLIVAQEIIKDVIHILTKTFELEHLPLHLCGISIFITLLYAYKPSKLTGNMLYYICFPGALSALLFPDWVNLPMLNFSCINSFTIHAWLIMVPIILIANGDLKPDTKTIPKLFVFMLSIAIPIYFLNKIWNTNFLFINTPSPGSPLVPLANIFGNPGYVFGAAGLLLIVWAALSIPWVIIYNKKNKEKI